MAADEREAGSDRRPRRRGVAEDSDTPFSEQATDARGAEAVRAYCCSLCGLIPGLGLVLGPLALVLGLWAGLRGRRDPGFKGGSLCKAAVVLGLLTALSQWGGLALMIRGLRPD